jgi:hypothetical protein
MRTKFCSVVQNLSALIGERASFHPFGAWNSELARRFLENLCTSLLKAKYYHLYVALNVLIPE